MEIIENPQRMQARANQLRAEGKTIGFVPTMGYLHEGHLSLMQRARQECQVSVLSIFVNPTQFGPTEDLDRYPRDMEGDLQKAASQQVDLVYLPSTRDMYPEGFRAYVTVEELSEKLCGASRPGHFRGVATVVLKLFNLVKPHRADFGEKDYQQLTILRKMVEDLNLDLEIVGMPTVREHDGLAMSSRNSYLSAEERRSALSLSRALRQAQEMVGQGERSAAFLREEIRRIIEGEPATSIDYVAVCHPLNLKDLERIEDRALIALAVKVGNTRLIDNCVVEVPR
ncbi:MAG: pantoate--beta-alanine ligase [Candidatus Tectomicrobia bacterium]|uniref:Pantothenate synthetase n=1 Tax=Tectimicrobiota bacterium TaxID=2528274 RepID=A0A932G253_UNCTE|nr:pantoate--beta-alanine ligase [Candidatus Tectomicrobia bacterium]